MSVGHLAANQPGALTDGPFGSNLKTEHYTESGPRVIRLQNIGGGQFVDEYAHISNEHFARLSKHSVKGGDVLVAMLGERLPRACLAPDSLGPAIVKADCARLRVNESVASPRFVMHLLNSPTAHKAAADLVHGVGRPRLGLGILRSLELPVADRHEQDLIVAAIESHFSRLDAATATLERVQRNLERYRASVLKAAVEGRLVPTEAELAKKEGRTYEPASTLLNRILTERRRRWEKAEVAKLTAKGKNPTDDKWKAKYEEPSAPDVSGLPDLPEGWCWASMAQLITRLTSGSRDWTDYYDRGNGVFLMAQNVRPGRLDLSFVQRVDPPIDDASRVRSQVEEGDLLVTIVGANTGDVCRVPRPLPEHFVCQSVALMRPGFPSLSRYLDAYLNSPPGQSVFEGYMYGQGRPHLGFEHLEATPVPLPPAAEADRIATAIDDNFSLADAASAPLATNEARIARLRQSILKWAFEGRLIESSASTPVKRATGST